MDILKKIALGVLSPLFVILLFATAFDIGFVRTATHPATVKKLVAESGIYDSVIPSVLQQTKSIDTSLGTISASDPAIQKAASQAITPQYIKQNTETAIDSIYRWLDGKTAQPDFRIDLSGAKTNFSNNVATSVSQRLSSLPACTTAQSVALTAGGQFDAINSPCLPRGVTAEAAAAQIKDSINGNKDFLDKTTISADSIKNSGDNQSVFTNGKLANAPKQYQRAKKTPLILSILTILTGVGIVFLSSTWQKGLRHVGINLVVIGVLMLAFSYGLNRAVNTQIVPKFTNTNAVIQKDVRALITDITQQIDKNYWYFGGLYTVLGAGAISGVMIANRRNVTKPTARASADTVIVSPPEAVPQKSAPKTPAKRKIKIQ